MKLLICWQSRQLRLHSLDLKLFAAYLVKPYEVSEWTGEVEKYLVTLEVHKWTKPCEAPYFNSFTK